MGEINQSVTVGDTLQDFKTCLAMAQAAVLLVNVTEREMEDDVKDCSLSLMQNMYVTLAYCLIFPLKKTLKILNYAKYL